jgi:hypothetical protein
MTTDEKNLLLTVARILRAKISREIYAEQDDDLWALNEALAPFDPEPGAHIEDTANQAGQR